MLTLQHAPAIPVRTVDLLVRLFVIRDGGLHGVPFEPAGRVLHGDVAEQDELGEIRCKFDGRKQALLFAFQYGIHKGIVMSDGIQFGEGYL